jgi:hypothetical protein
LGIILFLQIFITRPIGKIISQSSIMSLKIWDVFCHEDHECNCDYCGFVMTKDYYDDMFLTDDYEDISLMENSVDYISWGCHIYSNGGYNSGVYHQDMTLLYEGTWPMDISDHSYRPDSEFDSEYGWRDHMVISDQAITKTVKVPDGTIQCIAKWKGYEIFMTDGIIGSVLVDGFFIVKDGVVLSAICENGCAMQIGDAWNSIYASDNELAIVHCGDASSMIIITLNKV